MQGKESFLHEQEDWFKNNQETERLAPIKRVGKLYQQSYKGQTAFSSRKLTHRGGTFNCDRGRGRGFGRGRGSGIRQIVTNGFIQITQNILSNNASFFDIF